MELMAPRIPSESPSNSLMQTTQTASGSAIPFSTTKVNAGAGTCIVLPTLRTQYQDVGPTRFPWTRTVPLIGLEEASTQLQLPGPVGLRQAAQQPATVVPSAIGLRVHAQTAL